AKRPYTIVFVSDLGAGDRLDGPSSLDKDNFADFVRQAGVNLRIAVKSPLAAGDWDLALTFDSIKSFDALNLAKQTPAGRWRFGLREKVLARQNGSITAADLQNALQAAVAGDTSLAWVTSAEADVPPRSSASSSTSPVPPGGSVLDLVDVPSDRSKAA